MNTTHSSRCSRGQHPPSRSCETAGGPSFGCIREFTFAATKAMLLGGFRCGVAPALAALPPLLRVMPRLVPRQQRRRRCALPSQSRTLQTMPFHALLILVASFTVMSAVAAPLQLVTTIDPSVATSVGGGGNSMNPIISRDGRYVLFASTADNLALTRTTLPSRFKAHPKMNVFLRDRAQGTTPLSASISRERAAAMAIPSPWTFPPTVSMCSSKAAPATWCLGDTNNATDVFVRDLVGGTNILVSRSFDGGVGMNGFSSGGSGQSSITPDGRYVAFASAATNLVANDTNGIQDIFVRDLQTGTTVRASSDALAAHGSCASRLLEPG